MASCAASSDWPTLLEGLCEDLDEISQRLTSELGVDPGGRRIHGRKIHEISRRLGRGKLGRDKRPASEWLMEAWRGLDGLADSLTAVGDPIEGGKVRDVSAMIGQMLMALDRAELLRRSGP